MAPTSPTRPSEMGARRLGEENEELNRVLQDREKAHLLKVESLYQQHTAEKNDLDTQKRMVQQKNGELEEDLVKALRERDRAVTAYDDLNRNVQQRVMACIDDVVNAHTRRLHHALTR